MFDVAIIGCGVIGAATAFALSKFELSVAVIEKENDVSMGTTRANSAIIHAGYDPEPGTLMAKLNVKGSRMTETLCEELDVPYKKVGSLVLALSKEQLLTVKKLYERGLQNGVEDMKILTAEEVKAMEPQVNEEVLGALYAPGAAIIDPWDYCLALAETAVRNGVTLLLNHAVTDINSADGHYIIHTNKGDIKAKTVINAAGVYCGAIHNMVSPQPMTVHPNIGEYYLIDKADASPVSHVLFQCPGPNGKGVLVAPTVHGNLIVGPNTAAVSDFERVNTTTEGLNYVRRAALLSVPSIRFKSSIRNFSGLRAITDRNDFIIEQPVKGFIDLAGIKSPGLSAAPAIAEEALALLEKSGLVMKDKKSYHTTLRRVRFSLLPQEEKMALIRKNPLYGRVICRCETITEGEILDTLQTPIPPCSIDGVKRRAGTGMGRCQGGFCAPRVLEILSRELKIPPMDIPMDRTGSMILIGETKEVESDV